MGHSDTLNEYRVENSLNESVQVLKNEIKSIQGLQKDTIQIGHINDLYLNMGHKHNIDPKLIPTG